MNDKTHAKLSPSAAKRWMTCPGSVKAIEKLNIKDKPSKYAAEGTAAHELHELCLTNKRKADKYLGETIVVDGMKFKVNQNMVDAVQMSLDYIDDRISIAEFEGLQVEVQVEVRSSLEYLGIPGLDGGTSDVVLLFLDGEDLVAVEVYDYKHGSGVAVECVDNPQAMCYALGICAKYQAEANIPVRISIGQPRAHHNDGRIRSWDITAEYLINWQEEKLVPTAKATLEENAKFQASDDGCRFCPVSGNCPTLYKCTQEVAMIDFDESEDNIKLPDVKTLNPEQKRFIMDHRDIIRSFIVAVENQVKQEVNLGSQDYNDRYKLVRKTTHRKFSEDAFDELTSPLFDHLSYDDVYEEKTRSMSEIERRLNKSAGVKTSKEIMDKITIKPEGELVIVSVNDKRKAEQPSLIGDFTNLN